LRRDLIASHVSMRTCLPLPLLNGHCGQITLRRPLDGPGQRCLARLSQDALWLGCCRRSWRGEIGYPRYTLAQRHAVLG
jgi:hypothetical protein